MKLKCQPEDFRVEELPLVIAGRDRSLHVLPPDQAEYRHDRSRRSHLPALEPGRPPGQLRRSQRPACRHGPVPDDRRRPRQTHQHSPASTLEPVGRLAQPYGPQHFRGNRFQLVLRDMTEADVRRASSEIPSLSTRRTAQLFRRSAVRLGRLFRSVHRSCLAGRRSRARARAGAGRGQSVRPLGGQGSEGHPARLTGANGPRPRPGWNARPLAAS